MANATSRAAYLGYADGTRVIGVLAVVFLHAAATGVVRYGELPALAWWTANLVDSSCRWAVPVFLMLSGALNLDPERRESAGKFYRRRLTRVGIPLAFWSAFYFAWGATYHGRDITLEAMGAELLRGPPERGDDAPIRGLVVISVLTGGAEETA
jgi:surface polysaccharide O-acyltransferase-like enzyme